MTPDPVIALIHAAGLRGYDAPERGSRASRNDDAAPILAIIHAAGLAGFARSEEQEAEAKRDAAPLSHATSPLPRAAMAPASISPVSVPPRMSRLEYAIIEIAAEGGDAALADLEAKMARPFSAELPEGSAYSVAALPGGGTARAFWIASHQRQALEPFVGALGSPALKLRLGSIPIGAFERAGPGAVGRNASGPPPQLADDVPRALGRALR